MTDELSSNRCYLRPIQDGDQAIVYQGLSDPEVIKYYGVSFSSFEATAAQMHWYRQLLQEGTGVWFAICEKISGKMVGACGVNNLSKEHQNAEIGFWLLSRCWGQGYMAECLPLLINFSREKLNLHKLIASVEPENKQSQRLLSGLNFLYEGTCRQSEFKNDRYIDISYYGLLL